MLLELNGSSVSPVLYYCKGSILLHITIRSRNRSFMLRKRNAGQTSSRWFFDSCSTSFWLPFSIKWSRIPCPYLSALLNCCAWFFVQLMHLVRNFKLKKYAHGYLHIQGPFSQHWTFLHLPFFENTEPFFTYQQFLLLFTVF